MPRRRYTHSSRLPLDRAAVTVRWSTTPLTYWPIGRAVGEAMEVLAWLDVKAARRAAGHRVRAAARL